MNKEKNRAVTPYIVSSINNIIDGVPPRQDLNTWPLLLFGRQYSERKQGGQKRLVHYHYMHTDRVTHSTNHTVTLTHAAAYTYTDTQAHPAPRTPTLMYPHIHHTHERIHSHSRTHCNIRHIPGTYKSTTSCTIYQPTMTTLGSVSLFCITGSVITSRPKATVNMKLVTIMGTRQVQIRAAHWVLTFMPIIFKDSYEARGALYY